MLVIFCIRIQYTLILFELPADWYCAVLTSLAFFHIQKESF